MDFHPLADIFPMMDGKRFDALKADIEEHGLREPITIAEGKIADGRNRYKACIALGIEPLQVEWDGDGDLLAFIVSMNLARRHLNESQRGMVAAKIADMERTDTLKQFASDASIEASVSQPQAAKMLNVSRATVQRAKKVVKDGIPELQEAVKISNEIAEQRISVSAAAIAAKMPEHQQVVVMEKVAEGKHIKTAIKEVKQATKKQRVAKVPTGPTPLIMVGDAANLNLADESIDLIITSPPYNLGSEYWPMGADGRQPRNEGIGYEDAMCEEKYQEWQIACLCEWYRVAKLGASLFYNHKVRQNEGAILHPLDWLRDVLNPWILRQEIIWDRGSTHNHCPSLFWPHDERVYWMTKGKPIIPEDGIGLPSIWRFHGPVADTWHPAPFSPELPTMCLQALGRPGIIVLDPFGGRMTTCVVASEAGYEAIGVDINPEYVRRAREENGWMIKSDNCKDQKSATSSSEHIKTSVGVSMPVMRTSV